jgi:putative two-component system response regulator
MITAHDDRDMRLSGLEAGVDDFLSKPFDRLELRARLKTITRLDRYRKLNQERSKLEQALRGLEEGHRQLQQAYEEIIVGWSRAMDLRDKETEGHSQRVANMTVTLAREMGMDEEALVHIYRGALLHDLGKLGIPDQILLKPGSLTESEWSVMRQHPNFAYNMLSPITYLRPALDIPYCHHEKWNGLGYPRGLKGNEIPLAARIFAVADVWDALTSDRPYRPAWSEADALQYIHSQAGEHFDPQVVETFEPMINSDKR